MSPVTVVASVRYITAPANSLTVEGRPIGDWLSITSFGVLRLSGVWTTPGATAFTRMPSFAYSMARCRDRDNAAAGLLRQHLLNGKLRDVQEAVEVRGDERPEVLGCVVRERLGEEDARVIDQRINRVEARQRRLDDFGGRCRL